MWLVRHAESHSNATGVVDDGDAALTEEGVQQARLLAKRIARLPEVEVIVTSPMERARQTARTLARVRGGGL